jgi:hypothetical protein
MKHLRRICGGLLMLLALSLTAFAGDMGCPGDMGQPQTQPSSNATPSQSSPAVDGEMGAPCKAGDMGAPCKEGDMGNPLAGEIGFPVTEILISILFS